MASPVVRLTLFKIPDPQDIDYLVAKFSTIQTDAVKVPAKPYIFAASTSKLHEEPRNQGYTVVARIIFHSMADMEYYDKECPAHAAIKEAGKGKATEPPLIVSMDANPAEAKRMMAMLKETYGDDGEGGKV
ncbi:uncharacterized protein BDZ99DRAFT_461184 [Mytilinidion resinicola]|uniref:Stress-response A/B barrel domain-containing protein n=1 Tax=Mytilinidion resinicola TaxID=574789 RepID=A0A6A6YUR0_9PEZI|nr:uncharacterized protein BDZ99DRAFT_461184 [Mytilinidion resinicola]KAF2812511.1 hypothetical protein BDZ99DRAFT_461184 [Mytilinidion resinicola]